MMTQQQREAALRRQREMLTRQEQAIEATKGMIALLEQGAIEDPRQTEIPGLRGSGAPTKKQ